MEGALEIKVGKHPLVYYSAVSKYKIPDNIYPFYSYRPHVHPLKQLPFCCYFCLFPFCRICLSFRRAQLGKFKYCSTDEFYTVAVLQFASWIFLFNLQRYQGVTLSLAARNSFRRLAEIIFPPFSHFHHLSPQITADFTSVPFSNPNCTLQT